VTTTYIRVTPLDTAPAECYPEHKIAACYSCTRNRIRPALPPEQRRKEIIDASLFVKDGVCPMFEGRP